MTDGNLDMVLATSVVFLIVGFSMLTIYKISLMIGFEKGKKRNDEGEMNHMDILSSSSLKAKGIESAKIQIVKRGGDP